MKMKIEISDIFLLLGLIFLGVGLYLRFDLGISLSVVGGVVLVIGLKMAPKRRVE